MLDLRQLTESIDQRFSRTAIRLDVLDFYTSGGDGGDVDRYLRGENTPDAARKRPWYAWLGAERAAGKGIRIADLAEQPPCPPRPGASRDFWLIDNQHVILKRYNQDGLLAAAEIATPGMLPRFQEIRGLALSAAKPFSSYRQRHPEYHQPNQGPGT